MNLSVVIPTYNRREQLSEVIDCLLKSEVGGMSAVEIIVVDDGSPQSVQSVIDSKTIIAPFSLKLIRQENSGPAEARNNGFQQAANEIVLFIDDDILVFPNLVRKHAEAHLIHKGAVIFGQSLYFPPKVSTPSFRYLNKLFDDGLNSVKANQSEEFVKVELVASGNLSVEKKLFEKGKVYGKNLTIPASEEYDLSHYLMKKNIPVYFASEIKGWHLQPTAIEDCCKQNYKYGLGLAELAQKQPDALQLKQLRHIFEVNRGIQKEDSSKLKIKKSVRKVLSNKFVREKMLASVNFFEKLTLADRWLFTLYKLVVGSYFAAGIKDGIKMFSGEKK